MASATLVAGVTARDSLLPLDDNDLPVAGAQALLDEEVVEFVKEVRGRWQVKRGQGGTVRASHDLGTELVPVSLVYAPVEEYGDRTFEVAGGGSDALVNPTDIAGCALWLDASTLDLEDGDPVTVWPDGSGGGNDATQAPSEDAVWDIGTGFADGGTVTFGFDNGVDPPVEVGPLAFDASNAAVDAAFTSEGVPVTITGTDLSGGLAVTFTGQFNVDVTVADDSTTGGGGPGANAGGSENTVGRGAAPGYTANLPVCKTAVLNGKRVVRFDDSAEFQYLALSGDGLDLLRDVDGLTIAVVVANIADSNDARVFSASQAEDIQLMRARLTVTAATGGPVAFEVDNREGDENGIQHVLNDAMTGGADDLRSGPVIFVGTVDLIAGAVALVSSQYSDPLVAAFGVPREPMPDTSSLAILIGALPGTVISEGTTGDIAELVVWRRALNAKERRRVIEYLADRWATL